MKNDFKNSVFSFVAKHLRISTKDTYKELTATGVPSEAITISLSDLIESGDISLDDNGFLEVGKSLAAPIGM